MLERHQVVLFLEMMKMAVRQQFIFIGREKNLAALASLGIVRTHAESLVMGLKPKDYVSGPEADYNNPDNEMWVFGLTVSSREVYVKLQVFVEPARCICVSFHESDYPMHYPLREARPTKEEENPR